MPKSRKRNFAKEVESVLRQVLAERPDDEITLAEVTQLAIASGRIEQEFLLGIQQKAIQAYFGKILNRAQIILDDGRTVRAFQNYVKFTQTEDGRELQLHIWKDIRSMSRAQMMLAAQHRKKHIDDSRQSLANDIAYWNENVRPKGERTIQLTF